MDIEPRGEEVEGKRVPLGALRSGKRKPGLCTCALRTSVRNMLVRL